MSVVFAAGEGEGGGTAKIFRAFCVEIGILVFRRCAWKPKWQEWEGESEREWGVCLAPHFLRVWVCISLIAGWSVGPDDNGLEMGKKWDRDGVYRARYRAAIFWCQPNVMSSLNLIKYRILAQYFRLLTRGRRNCRFCSGRPAKVTFCENTAIRVEVEPEFYRKRSTRRPENADGDGQEKRKKTADPFTYSPPKRRAWKVTDDGENFVYVGARDMCRDEGGEGW